MEKVSRWRQRFSQLRKIRGLLENRLMKPKAMRVGSVVRQYMFCGKVSCACHRDPTKKHGPYYYLSYKEGGKSRYKYLGKAESPEVEVARNYQIFQRGRTDILDATDLPTTKRLRGCGVKKGVKKVWGRGGQEVEVAEYVYGYKLLFAGGEAHAGGGGGY